MPIAVHGVNCIPVHRGTGFIKRSAWFLRSGGGERRRPCRAFRELRRLLALLDMLGPRMGHDNLRVDVILKAPGRRTVFPEVDALLYG